MLRRWISTTVLRSKPGSLNAWASEAASNVGSLSKAGTWNSLAKELNDGAGAAALASVGEIETIRIYPDHEGALRLVLGRRSESVQAQLFAALQHGDG